MEKTIATKKTKKPSAVKDKVAVKKKATKKKPDSKSKVEVKSEVKKEVKKKSEYLYAVGKRKSSVALVRVYKKGTGKITVNKKEFSDYFSTLDSREAILAPLKLIGQMEKLDITVKTLGGGVNSQAEAVRNGMSKALIQLNPNFKKPLKKAGYLSRDARKKERKKPGLKRARRAPQWKKR